ncbi:hypothetical protein FQN49_002529 [Arthroderma sp. PD_2]|nr:hypothetical protein FQN49_002529 [Arthroderma sp. PD_2]
MANLALLPLENINEIVAHLRLWDDILALSLASRSLYFFLDIPVRRKYHRIRLRSSSHRTAAFALLLNILEKPYLGHYVRELEVAPDADWSSPNVLEDFPIVPTSREHKASPQFNKDDLLKDAIRSAGFESEDTVERILSWMQYTNSSHARSDVHSELGDVPDGLEFAAAEALAVMFILKCPNIRKLKIHFFSPGSLILPFLERINESSSLNCLQRLTVVNCCIGSSSPRHTYLLYDFLGIMAPFQQLPSVKTISVNYVKLVNADEIPEFIPGPRTSNFSNIRINHSFMPSSYLVQILDQTKRLEEFTYTVGCRFLHTQEKYYGRIYPTYLKWGLLPHRSTLRVLNLDLDADLYSQIDPVSNNEHAEHLAWMYRYSNGSSGGLLNSNSQPAHVPYLNPILLPISLPTPLEVGTDNSVKDSFYYQPIGSLQQFTALTHLSIGVNLLLGEPRYVNISPPPESFRLIDILPPNLERLSIRGYRPGECQFHTEQLSHLLRNMDQLPFLKEVLGVKGWIPSARHLIEEDFRHGIWAEEVEWADDTDAAYYEDPPEEWGERKFPEFPGSRKMLDPPPCIFNFYLDDGHGRGQGFSGPV